MIVSELSSELQFISDTNEVKSMCDYFGLSEDDSFDSFFVATKDGDYIEVWGMFGIVPFSNRHVYTVDTNPAIKNKA